MKISLIICNLATRGKVILCVAGAAFFLAVLSQATADDKPRGSVLNITEENDLVVKTDRHYTQGLRVSLLFNDTWPRWADGLFEKIPQFGLDHPVNKFGVAVGQNIYTPLDTTTQALVKDDRPYAAWLYVGIIWQRRGMFSKRIAGLDSAELDLGVVGRSALGKDAQVWMHQLRGFDLPKGWHNQLRNEAGVQLRLARQWRFSAGNREWFAADVIPELGCSLGNVATTANAGGTIRFGYNMPDDFGVQTIDSIPSNNNTRPADKRRHFGFYGFGGFAGRLVGYTTFLDGNMFRGSHSIAKTPWVADMKIGCVAVLKYCDVSFTYVVRTREFVGQRDSNSFGSVGVSVKF